MKNSGNIIETGRLKLRHFTISDADSMLSNWANDPDVVRYMPYNVCSTIEETQKAINDWFSFHEKTVAGSYEVFAIELKSTGEVIGTIDYVEHDTEARYAEVGYQLGKSWWGYGYAAEALKALIKYCFEKISLNRIWADYDSRNTNSGKVLEKSGFLYEKTTRQIKNTGDKPTSRIQYAIHADHYFNTANS